MNNVLAINAGSSSLKFQFIQMPDETVIAKGLVERIGLPEAIFTFEVDDNKDKTVSDIPNHEVAVKLLLEKLTTSGVIKSLDEINAVGHRVVHGGEKFNDSILITEEVIKDIEDISELAPLHNPANLTGIRAFKEVLPNIPMVAVFDTAFHQTMPPQSYLYSLPYEYYENYGIRKYGFHGTSHKYISQRAAELMDKPLEDLRLISCHLGNGASIAAIKGGESIDTSMGFTPLAGVTMGTRSGNIDPALIPYIMEKTGKSAEEVVDVLNKESGMLALSGFSSDLRDIEQQAETNKRAGLALDVFAGRIHKYIGSYAAKMSGVDAIIFTAGVGENSDTIRAKVLNGLEFMGIYWDQTLNHGARGKEVMISYPHSPVKVIVIPTNEEVMIARDTVRLSN